MKNILIAGNIDMGTSLADSAQVVFDDYKEQYVKLVEREYIDLGDFSPPIPKRFRHLRALPVRDSKTNPKQGRNDLCLCESGKKYKNCCIKNK